QDLSWREIAVFVPIVAMIFVMGVFPRPFLKVTENSVDRFISDYKGKLAEPDGPAHLIGQPPPGEAPAEDSAAPEPGEEAAAEGAAPPTPATAEPSPRAGEAPTAGGQP